MDLQYFIDGQSLSVAHDEHVKLVASVQIAPEPPQSSNSYPSRHSRHILSMQKGRPD